MKKEGLSWDDVHELGYQLFTAHPEVDPLTVRFTDLHGWVCALDDFTGDPKASNEKLLEAIQMAWVDEREE